MPGDSLSIDKKTVLNWSVYIIEASDGSFYTGITTDVERRFAEHAGSRKGAKFFNGKHPVRLLFKENGHNRSSASKREAQIKSMTRLQKERLLGCDY